MIHTPVKSMIVAVFACGLLAGNAHAAVCAKPIVNVSGVATSIPAATSLALHNWKTTVAQAWGAAYANYSLARNKARRCWKTQQTVQGNTKAVYYCRVTGKPCRLVFKKGMKLKQMKKRGQ